MPLTTDSLVSTKLRPSQVRPKLVARPRLTARLEREAGRRLTLISAPAGFGKTTLLVEWLRGRADSEGPVAWVSLDETDSDPARFLAYLVAALQTIRAGVGEGVLASLRSPEPPPVESVMALLINDLGDVPHDFALILDDYHLIDAEPVHEAVAFLLDHLPPQAHLIISSRADPPLRLSRLRVRGQMTELRAADLRFTPEETAGFLKDVTGLDLSAEDVAALEAATEGWIATLQLAALSMRDREDVSGFIESFSGRHRHVLDYLAEEVLERQPERIREFLLETSILNRLTGALCDAVTGRSHGQAMLEKLERDNLFVVALDDERCWYRYHHLFGNFLRVRLEREDPGRIKELHLRAAAWYERNGLSSEAVGHALSAGDHDRAADLAERAADEVSFRGETVTLLRWLRALPVEAKRRRPRLLLEHATALMVVGRLEDVEPLLREAEHAAGEGSAEDQQLDQLHRRYLLGYAAAIRSWRANLLGDPQDGIEFARRALALLPEHDPRPRIIAGFSLAAAYRYADDLEAASAAFARTAELARAAGNTYAALRAVARQAELQVARGRLREADDVLQRALRSAAERGDASLPAAGEVHIAVGELLYERNDLESATQRLAEGMELARRVGQLGTLVDGYVALSRARRARSDAQGAFEAAREADRLAQGSGVTQTIVKVAAWKARLHLAQGEPAAATLEQERAAGASGVPPFVQELERATLARLLIARDDQDEALRLLEKLREAAEAADRKGSAIEILTLQALALRAKGEKTQAVNVLVQALSLAEPEGYVRTFVDEGPSMAALLSEVLESQQRRHLTLDIPAHYLRKLLAALERDISGVAPPTPQLPEPLSERELEVLQLVAAGKSNREIAKELFVTAGTVKTHIKNIYRKLDAHSRTQALVRARELNLL